MSYKFNSLRDLFEHEIKDLYSAETQLVDALPKMAETASNVQLKEGFQKHLEQTRNQRDRLERIAEICDFKPKGETCAAMKGLIEEGKEAIKSKADPAVKDAALIAAGQRVEHYEIAGYGTARNYAQRLELPEVVKLLEETLNEEKETDAELNQMAVEKVNVAAMNA